MTMPDDASDDSGRIDIAGLAQATGLTAQQVDSALAALVRAQGEPGDTAGLAAAKTGLADGPVRDVLEAVGGTAMLGRVARMIGDQGGLGSLAERDAPPQS